MLEPWPAAALGAVLTVTFDLTAQWWWHPPAAILLFIALDELRENEPSWRIRLRDIPIILMFGVLVVDSSALWRGELADFVGSRLMDGPFSAGSVVLDCVAWGLFTFACGRAWGAFAGD